MDYSLDKLLQEALGTQLYFSTAFHPQTYGQSKRVIQVLEDILRCCVLEFEGNWEKYLPLIEFSYNNSYQSSVKMAPYQPLIVKKSYADLKRKEIEFQVGDKVFIKVSPWKKVLRFGRKCKLIPRFIGPYEITKRIGPVAYRLALPPELDRIHNVPLRSITCYFPDRVKNQFLARETKELKNKKINLVKILWKKHGIEEATWEPEEAMRKQYTNLFTGKIFEDENPYRGEL
ncbi:reverse transcriptase [Gossypium australe]|uniref:Reverse transcriptase n=1 Tax=Gossypium australe TaxID=47621 RepID=A0A5B6UWM2_9ROSI|nr:reverse transcriptase [Gossypium australe]